MLEVKLVKTKGEASDFIFSLRLWFSPRFDPLAHDVVSPWTFKHREGNVQMAYCTNALWMICILFLSRIVTGL